uniref:Uncharacterized protein n=1 Tax=Thermus islandicus TaxID=540988 RepID=A0A7C2C1T3_9DEIN
MKVLEELGYEVTPIQGGLYGEKRRGGILYQVYLSAKGDLRLRRRRFLKEEARSLALAGVEGAWAARCELEENFFTFVSSEDLPHLVLAFEGLDLPDPPPCTPGEAP